MGTIFDGRLLQPRRGGKLNVLAVGRISTVHQDVKSLDDQFALCRQYVQSRYADGLIEFHVIQGRGSRGQWHVRPDRHRRLGPHLPPDAGDGLLRGVRG